MEYTDSVLAVRTTPALSVMVEKKRVSNCCSGVISDTGRSTRSGTSSGICSAVINRAHSADGAAIRQCAVENAVTLFTNLDTVRIVLDVLEEITNRISTTDAE